VGSGRGAREKEREAGRRWGADMQAWAARFKLDLNRFKRIQLNFEFLQTLFDPNMIFLCSKNLK
jgi:hypothetical protein